MNTPKPDIPADVQPYFDALKHALSFLQQRPDATTDQIRERIVNNPIDVKL